MKKNIILFFSILFTCSIFAQEKSFSEYLNHFKTISLPCMIEVDSVRVFFPSFNKEKKKNTISVPCIHKYICKANEKCDDDPSQFDYTYGIKINMMNYIIVVIDKECYECGTEYGESSTKYIAITYTREGKMINKCPITKASDQHFYKGRFSSINNQLEIEMMQGTVLPGGTSFQEYYPSILDYYVFKISDRGKISKEKIRSEKAKVKWFTKSPFFQISNQEPMK